MTGDMWDDVTGDILTNPGLGKFPGQSTQTGSKGQFVEVLCVIECPH